MQRVALAQAQTAPWRRPAFRARRVATAAQSASELPGGLRKIVGAFQMVPDPMSRYKQLLFFAAKLKPLPEELKTEAHKVQARVAPGWHARPTRAAADDSACAGLREPGVGGGGDGGRRHDAVAR